ncbi:hypothetical protein ACJMK2_009376 [Sinanodonta woodiana]|uniref:Regulator of microtubule dynamics protein 1 n=1 Tax=Sinanodonta woodiana TaxID=1069815 RepID=A0ABD3VC25_SINWO
MAASSGYRAFFKFLSVSNDFLRVVQTLHVQQARKLKNVLKIKKICSRCPGQIKKFPLIFSRYMPVFIPTLAALEAISLVSFKKEKQEQKVDDNATNIQVIILEADKLYAQDEVFKLYDFLFQYKDMANDEILWRLARATVDKGKHSEDPNVKKMCMYEAFEYIKQALALNSNNFACHKWYAILLDYTGEYEGTKKRIANSFLVRKHFVKAIKLNPKDATSLHSLGYWCFVFADMPWYQKKIASALFATPPTATYEEALDYFIKAEEVEPNFYSTNLLMLGKTFMRLKNYKNAKIYIMKAYKYPVKTPDDKKAHEEAMVLLKSLGVKFDD